MGVFSALTTAVSGMRAQSYALENISGNIANSRTSGFKRIDTDFVDLIPDTPSNRELAGSVLSRSKATTTVRGDISATSIDTNVAINGDGFFIVSKRNGGVGANLTFEGTDLYTRRGDFDFDANGYLVNGAGHYLKGLPLDPVTGTTVGSQASVLRITSDQIPARATTQVEYRANVPSYPETPNADPLIANSELITPASFGTNPLTTGTNTVVGSDLATFYNQSIAGGSVTVYDSLGQPVNLQLRWAKVDSVANGGVDTWNLFVSENTAATGATVAWRNIGTPFTFNTSGVLTSAATVTIPTITTNGVTITGVTLTTGGNGLTQYADQNGQIQANSIRQDGYTAGTLERTSVSQDGKVLGSYSNGQVVALAQLSIAKFNGANYLKRVDGGAFEQTIESGLPIVGTGNTNLVGGSVEQSNTDIADEFSKMIVTQQAYSANTRVINTSQQMLQDVLNIIR